MRPLSFRSVISIVSLTAAWCALWGEVSAANVLSGVLLATAFVLSGMGTPGRGRVRVVPLAKFMGLATFDLVSSTVNVGREILTPVDSTDESIIAVPLPVETRSHFLLLIVAVTVTPGTAVVDADADTGTLYLHLLHDNRRAEVVAHVTRLAELACQALPVTTPVNRDEGVAS
jgi:multicomponent Na+:H+ antiporter subunit E